MELLNVVDNEYLDARHELCGSKGERFHIVMLDDPWIQAEPGSEHALARCDITSKPGSSWGFNGKVLIRSTGQYHKITVTQLPDNSLRIVRHLPGRPTGCACSPT